MPFRPDILRHIREVKGWSQQDLAREADLSQSVIAKSENGKNTPGSQVLEKLAQALDCTIDYLHGRGNKSENVACAAAQMAFEVAQQTLTSRQRERCQRVVGRPDAPKTARGWISFAQMLEIALGEHPSTPSNIIERRSKSKSNISSARQPN